MACSKRWSATPSHPAVAEERRAYRHHKKRLARIVADQWLHVARFRLSGLKLRKRHEEKMQRVCIIEWRKVVHYNSRMSQLGERASKLCRFFLTKRSFHKILNFVQSKRVLRETSELTARLLRRKCLRKVLVALQNFRQAKILDCERWTKATQFWILTILRKCCLHWQSWVQERLSEVDMFRKADERWVIFTMRSAYISWKNVLLEISHEVNSSTTEDSTKKPQFPEIVNSSTTEDSSTEQDISETFSVDSAASEDVGLEAQILTEYLRKWYLSTFQKNARIDNGAAESVIFAERHCEQDLQELAVSWFVKSLVKRFLCIWKEQVPIMKWNRQNHRSATLHSKMHSLMKSFHSLRRYVGFKHSKQTLDELSMNCFHRALKRKSLRGFQLLHQRKQSKLVAIGQALSQWRTVRLHEHFEKWCLAVALMSKRRNLQQKSVNFRNRRLLVSAFQSWRAMKGLREDKEMLELNQLIRLTRSLHKSKRKRIWRAWKFLQKEMNIKRIREAQAVQFLIEIRSALVLRALHSHMQKQKLGRSLLQKAADFRRSRASKLAMGIWNAYVLLRSSKHLAAHHRRLRLLQYSLRSLIQWQKAQETETMPMPKSLFESIQRVPKSSPCNMMPQRAQPRRPAFLFEDLPSLSRKSYFTTNARDSRLVGKEVEWMEEVLLKYEELKVQIIQLKAQLALLLEERPAGVDQHDNKILTRSNQKALSLQQEIYALEARKMVQMPLIRAVLSRVQETKP